MSANKEEVLDMILDERKKLILKAIIDSYIDTAEPVGSRTIARRHEIGLSSATIRNEMADMEEMGLLEQPHTSAGRIPSVKGYRLYVDQLMPKRRLTVSEIEHIRSALKSKMINELGRLINNVSAVVSDITKYTSIAITPQMNKSILRRSEILPVYYDRLLVIIATDAGIVRNSLVTVAGGISSSTVEMISNFLNNMFAGKTLESINLESIKDEITLELGIDKNVIEPILEGVDGCIKQIFSSEVYLEGATNIFNFPEFNDILKAKQFLDVLNTKDLLYALMKRSIENNGGIKVRIGTENEFDEIKDCSVVTATYSVNNEIIGSIGVIGPTRMEYSKVIASLNYVSKMINKEISRLFGVGSDNTGNNDNDDEPDY